jgi:hypothetical protein
MDYFDAIPPVVGPQSAQDYATSQHNNVTELVARDNELAENSQIDRELIVGRGARFLDSGCEVTVVSGKVRIANGFFMAGAGADSGDASYFPGLRIKQIAGESGYIELTGADAPPLSQGQTHGYMSAYGDVVWFATEQTSAEQIADLYGRWYLGRFATDGSGATSKTAGSTHELESLAGLLERLEDAEAAIENFEALNAGELPFWDALKASSTDNTGIKQYVSEQIAANVGGDSGDSDSGGTVVSTTPERDETTLNTLRNAYLMLTAHDNALDLVPLLLADVIAPGRGHWEDLVDETFTTVTIDTEACVFGD